MAKRSASLVRRTIWPQTDRHMYQRIAANFNIALEAVMANKLRSLLTGLGIIFGVAAVIAMMAIGAGAQEEILEQIKLVGVNNIVITPRISPYSKPTILDRIIKSTHFITTGD